MPYHRKKKRTTGVKRTTKLFLVMIVVSLLMGAVITLVIEKGRGFMERIDNFSLEELDPETREKLKEQVKKYYKENKERDQEIY